MRVKDLCLCVGMCAGVAAAAAQSERPALQRLDSAIEVTPERVARVRYEQGRVRVVSDWVEYLGRGAGRRGLTRVYDCFGDDNSDGYMDDTGACFTSSTSRWFFGTAYCNMFVTNDHSVWGQTDIEAGFQRVDLGWYWTCAGSETERCYIAVLTQNSVPCEPDSFDHSGWVLDYGTLDCNPGGNDPGYYYSNTELSTGAWPIPPGGTGSHILLFAKDVTMSGGLTPATCAQAMLWGTRYGGRNQRGDQNELQLDDDNPGDGVHGPGECYDYSHECPDPLGAMVQFWGERDPECLYADYNGDGSVNTQDLTAFLNDWAPGNGATDCNGDGAVDTRDLVCYLNIWNSCKW
ncbi:MAG: hypothetical protein HND58_12415 [Planctomycetota bacterium]|nr:MAG: hypothetical protein HND58_12415 [Planctomycetota bacterium]